MYGGLRVRTLHQTQCGARSASKPSRRSEAGSVCHPQPYSDHRSALELEGGRCSAIVRALASFVTNLQSGQSAATKAMLVEAVYAIFIGGLIGALSQQLRRAKPLWATALLICLGLLGVMTLAQAAIHHKSVSP
jgi:hypothetical protein